MGDCDSLLFVVADDSSVRRELGRLIQSRDHPRLHRGRPCNQGADTRETDTDKHYSASIQTRRPRTYLTAAALIIYSAPIKG